jgi:predicted DNA-binding protein with PD1-like motif
MKVLKHAEGYLIRLERGEEVTRSLTQFLKEAKINAGTVTGIGGIANADLGFYDLNKREYLHQIIPGNLELIHYSGNITLVDSEPFIHAHAVVSGPDYLAKAGHFFEARVAITGEFVIKPSDWTVSRAFDDATGLKLMDL